MRWLYATRWNVEKHVDDHIWLRIRHYRDSPENPICIEFDTYLCIERDKFYMKRPAFQGLQKKDKGKEARMKFLFFSLIC